MPVFKEFLLFVAANSLGCSSVKLERKERKKSSQISHYSLCCTVPLSVTSIYLPEGDNLFFLLTLPYLLHYTINKARGLCFTVQADEKEIRLLIFLFSSLKAKCMTNCSSSFCGALYFMAIRKDFFNSK